jgi:hypothetical protein
MTRSSYTRRQARMHWHRAARAIERVCLRATDPTSLYVYLAMTRGLRRCEILALHWHDLVLSLDGAQGSPPARHANRPGAPQ